MIAIGSIHLGYTYRHARTNLMQMASEGCRMQKQLHPSPSQLYIHGINVKPDMPPPRGSHVEGLITMAIEDIVIDLK